uniref:DUF834 domain-containing protein n=1 Tax=Oryza punctata TaxID=4537 RepID=A0A0E0K8A0_ORYPU
MGRDGKEDVRNGCGGSSRTNDGDPARSCDGWGSAQAPAQAAVTEDVLTRMDAAEVAGRTTAPCLLAGWMGIGGGGGGGEQTDEEGSDASKWRGYV